MQHLTNTAVLLLVLGPLFSSCKSEEKKPDHFGMITSDLNTLQVGLKDGIYNVDTVTKSIDKAATASGDLRKPLAELQGSVAELEGTSSRIRSLDKELKAKQAAYETSSEADIKTIEDANMRRTAEQGRATIAASFRTVDQECESLGVTYREWEAKVKHIVSTLEANLSPETQKALASKVREANDLAPRVKEKMRKLSSTLESLSTSMQS